MYTALNKLGVGVSIHSFVTSASVQAHYGAITSAVVLAILVAVSWRLAAPAFYVALLLLFYCGIRSFNIVKPTTV